MNKKTLQKTVLFLMGTLFLFIIGCGKNTNFGDYFKGKIDGVPFECTTMGANEPEPGSNSTARDPNLRIEGSWLNHSIKLHLLQETIVTAQPYQFETGKIRYGTITDNNNEIFVAGYFGGIAASFYGSGKVIIHEINDKSVRGTFEFVAINVITNVTRNIEGEFHLHRK